MRALDAKDHQEKSYVSSGNTSFPARNFSNFLPSTCLVRRILSGLGTALKFSLAAVSDQQMGVCIGQSEGPATGQYKIKAHKISPDGGRGSAPTQPTPGPAKTGLELDVERHPRLRLQDVLKL